MVKYYAWCPDRGETTEDAWVTEKRHVGLGGEVAEEWAERNFEGIDPFSEVDVAVSESGAALTMYTVDVECVPSFSASRKP